MPAMKITPNAAMRARDVSRPRAEHLAEAEAAEASAAAGSRARPGDAASQARGGDKGKRPHPPQPLPHQVLGPHAPLVLADTEHADARRQVAVDQDVDDAMRASLAMGAMVYRMELPPKPPRGPVAGGERTTYLGITPLSGNVIATDALKQAVGQRSDVVLPVGRRGHTGT